MGRAVYHLDTFADIPRLSEESRRDAWRHAMAQLANQTADNVPVPLEGIDVPSIEQAVRWALSEGLCDDMAWLSPQHGAIALYELAGALGPGPERRQLGRRALEGLMQGNAATFAGLARRIALGSRRGLSGPGIATRVDLVTDLPDGVSDEANIDGLALALLTHPDLVRLWVIDRSTGSLPSRRLASRLLERAAREVLRRSPDRYRQAISLFERPDIQTTWMCLLADREPLVWRHAASARGLLSRAIPMLDGEILRDIDSGLSPTEWRRAAASAAAAIAVDPELSLTRCRAILSGKVFAKDPGVCGAMVLGLSRAVRADPEAAESLLNQLVQVGGVDVIEALVQLRHEHMQTSFGARAVVEARKRIASNVLAREGDQGRATLLRALDRELESSSTSANTPHMLFTHLRMAQEAFAFEGAWAAHVWAQETLDEADVLVDRLEATTPDSLARREESFFVLRELDYVLLQRSTLADLLALDVKSQASLARLDSLFGRVAEWLLRVTLVPGSMASEENCFTFELHRLRAMLHIVDSNAIVSAANVSAGHSAVQKDRKLRMARWLLDRLSDDVPRPLRRVLAASAARACDALMREEIGELSDVLVMVGDRGRDPSDIMTMAEAAMDPAMVHGLLGYSRFLCECQRATAAQGNPVLVLDALDELVKGMPLLGTPRVEALRGAVVAYESSLSALLSVRCLAQVAGGKGGGRPRIPPLVDAVGTLTRLAAGARRRMGGLERVPAPVSVEALRRIDTGAEPALRGNSEPMLEAVVDGVAVLRVDLPLGLVEGVQRALEHLLGLPLELQTEELLELVRPDPAVLLTLPAWMPANRVIGGFYVMRLLGHGGVGSVFVVCRAEDRNQRRPTLFAMKIPEYGPNVAHTLSEAEFFDLFRGEAGALLSIPRHPNLARFVTFDAGARPKPILVMELVEGPTLERLIATKVLDMPQALAILDGIAAGLEAMHALGIGHLDVKPGNVIMRVPDERLDVDLMMRRRLSMSASLSVATPVLVDFGLAGRRIRPGCATAEYGSPEIWGYIEDNQDPPPMPSDVYAFGCLVYETLTGETLIQDGSNTAVIAGHIRHDGAPPGFGRLRGSAVLEGLRGVLGRGLRRRYQDRCSISEMRRGLMGLGLGEVGWPIR